MNSLVKRKPDFVVGRFGGFPDPAVVHKKEIVSMPLPIDTRLVVYSFLPVSDLI